MTDAFAEMKKNRNVNTLSQKLDDMSGKNSNSYTDDRVWKPEPDKLGNFAGVIRFLPPPKGESSPFVETYNHGFKNQNGKWFIENCPTTIGEPCPICESNSELWNSGLESDKDLVRGNNGRKRKKSYYANILVISDQQNPENEGKNFLYRFGVKIMDKIEARASGNPAVKEEGCDVTQFWGGQDFVLKIRKGSNGYSTYEDSYFRESSDLFDGDDTRLEELWGNQYSLAEYHDPAKFKSYDELKTKLDKFLGVNNGSSTMRQETTGTDTPDFNPHQPEPQSQPVEQPPFNPHISEESTSVPQSTEPVAKKSAFDQFKELSEGN